MKLYIIRHGETAWNAQGKVQGRSDIPLNERGIALAKETSEALRDVAFDRIYTSPLIRARETARIMMGDRRIPFLIEKCLIEMCFGVGEGKSWILEDGRKNPMFENFFENPELFRTLEGGESFSEVIQRTGAFLKDLISDPERKDETILLATHGAAMRGLLANVKKQPLSEFWSGKTNKNCSITILDCSGTEIRILEEGKLFYLESND